ncbi:MAG: PepSY-associated TM helix domain-containing protein, partial [Candidatus Binatia bacterium]
ALVVGITGAINTLARPVLGYWQSTEMADMTAPYRGKPPLAGIGSVQQALTTARAAEPGMDLSFIAFPGTLFASPHHFAVYMTGTTPLTAKLLKPVLIDTQTNAVTAQRELPWYVTALLVSQPLHFGDYGGLPLKILWALLDLLTIIVLGSGLYLWLKRRNVPVEEWLGRIQPEEQEAVVITASQPRDSA